MLYVSDVLLLSFALFLVDNTAPPSAAIITSLLSLRFLQASNHLFLDLPSLQSALKDWVAKSSGTDPDRGVFLFSVFALSRSRSRSTVLTHCSGRQVVSERAGDDARVAGQGAGGALHLARP